MGFITPPHTPNQLSPTLKPVAPTPIAAEIDKVAKGPVWKETDGGRCRERDRERGEVHRAKPVTEPVFPHIPDNSTSKEECI
jgi:hypothetical protein